MYQISALVILAIVAFEPKGWGGEKGGISTSRLSQMLGSAIGLICHPTHSSSSTFIPSPTGIV